MRDIIELYRGVIIQIATPYSTGTGFYLKEPNVIVTNDHVIRDNRVVVVDGEKIDKQLVRVIFSDPKHDLAFLEAPLQTDMPSLPLGGGEKVKAGDPVVAMGHPFGLKFISTQGIISNTLHEQNDLNYWLHDAALNPGNSGGPLVDGEGRMIGVNTFIIKDGNTIGFALPVSYLKEAIGDYEEVKGEVVVRCYGCSNLVTEKNIDHGYCPHCGAKVELPSESEEYEPVGVAKTIEAMILEAGHDVALSRRGPNNWEIHEGSARINIAYYEKTGLITGDAYLCLLPKEKIGPLYQYLLRQNYEIEGLNFSIKDQDIILSLIIYDRYLNVETGLHLFKRLFEKADYYDNVLVEEYGAFWKYEEENEEELD
ncbi:MAG: trypsin-like peptidase domain-containing protein [Saprospiraceae bacterium]